MDEAAGTDLTIDDEAAGNASTAYRASLRYLTPAMQAFAEHWAQNRNQIKAYQHAFPGSTVNASKGEASRLFRDPRVQAEIARVIDRWTDHSAIRISELEHQVSRLAYSDLRSLYDEEGNIRPPHEWDADAAAAVHTLKTETTYDREGNPTVKRTVRLHDKLPALRTLLEVRGAFDKKKAPPGVQASFSFNFGGKAGPAGLPGSTFTVDMDTTKATKKPQRLKLKAIKALQAPERVPAKAQTRPKPVKRAPVTVENVTSQPPQTDRRPEPVPVVEIQTRKALFGDAA